MGTKTQFIASIEAKTQFVKWTVAPTLQETHGDIEKWSGSAFVKTPDGSNIVSVWFIVDKTDGVASWQNLDTIDPSSNVNEKKMAVLTNYLKSNFDAYFLGTTDLVNNWAVATVYKVVGGDATESRVIVHKSGTGIAHKIII